MSGPKQKSDRKPIAMLAEEEWEAVADGILSLSKSDGYPALIELLARIGQLAKDCAIEGEESELKYHRGWLACAEYLQMQLSTLAERAFERRQLEGDAAAEKEADEKFVSLMGLVAGDGPLS